MAKKIILLSILFLTICHIQSLAQPLFDVTTPSMFRVGSGSYPARLIDNTNNGWIAYVNSFVIIDLGSENQQQIKGYSIQNEADPSQYPTGWTLLGSHNQSSWVTIDTRSSVTWDHARQTKYFAAPAITAYRYYRFQNSTDPWVNYAELELFTDFSIQGVVFHDKNTNGTIEANESRLAGVPAQLKIVGTSRNNQTIQSTQTNAQGEFTFDLSTIPGGLPFDFSVVVKNPPGMQIRTEQTASNSSTVDELNWPYVYPDGAYIYSALFNQNYSKRGKTRFGFSMPTTRELESVHPNLIKNEFGGTFGDSEDSDEYFFKNHPNGHMYDLSTKNTNLFTPMADVVPGDAYSFANIPWDGGAQARTGVLTEAGKYVVTNSLGTHFLEYGRTSNNAFVQSGQLNQIVWGWKATTGATSGAWNDRFLAVNGANTPSNGSTTIFADTVSLLAGNQYSMGFYGKAANRWVQGPARQQPSQIAYQVALLSDPGTPIAEGSLTVLASTSYASDSLNLGWSKANTDFIANQNASYIVTYSLKAGEATGGNNVFLDNFYLRKSPYKITGTVFNDGNELQDGVVNGVPIAALNNDLLYAYLVEPGTGIILGSSSISADGTYELFAPEFNHYQITVSKVKLDHGQIYNEEDTNYENWRATGSFQGINNANGNTTSQNRLVAVYPANLTLDVTQIDFGFQHKPTAISQNYTIAPPAQNQSIILDDEENESLPGPLWGYDPEDMPVAGSLAGKTIRITNPPANGLLSYDDLPIASTRSEYVEITNYNPSLLQFQVTGTGYKSFSFDYVYVDEGKMVSDPATYSIDWNSMPVKLVDFKVLAAESTNAISWQTTEEVNSSHFVVERSRDITQFKPLGVVQAKGNSTDNNPYNFIDFNPLQSAYYRLKMVDIDGSFTYSTIRFIKNDKVISQGIYPNPADDRVYVKNLNANQPTFMQILTLEGKILSTGPVSDDGIDTSHLPAGIYLMKVLNGKQSETMRFVITR